jgi:hypothetical protein
MKGSSQFIRLGLMQRLALAGVLIAGVWFATLAVIG